MKKVLVVDDEESIRKLLEYNLSKEGYEVTSSADGKAAYDLAGEKNFDFIILDLMLPSMDGMDVCKQLRQDKVNTPILMLTAKDDELEKIIGLELGADDYMTKPFSPREVVARMKAILRRSRDYGKVASDQEDKKEVDQDPAEEEESVIQVGDITINKSDFSVTAHGQAIDMTKKEFELLTYLAERVDRIVSREILLSKIWDFDYSVGSRLVDVHISHLREKIEKDPKNPEYIITVRGFGYKFEVPKAWSV